MHRLHEVQLQHPSSHRILARNTTVRARTPRRSVVEKEPYVPAAETPRAVGDLDPRAEVDDGYDQGPDILSTPEVATGEEKSFAFWLGRGGESAEDDGKTNESEILVQVAAEEGTGDSVGKATSKG